MSKISSFEEMEVWQKGIELCELVYKITDNLSLNKDFALREQLRKSAISIPSNIAEGFERESNNSFIYFLIIAKGSCGELRTQILIANKVGHIDQESMQILVDKCIIVSKQLSNFIKYLRTQKQQTKK